MRYVTSVFVDDRRVQTVGRQTSLFQSLLRDETIELECSTVKTAVAVAAPCSALELLRRSSKKAGACREFVRRNDGLRDLDTEGMLVRRMFLKGL